MIKDYNYLTQTNEEVKKYIDDLENDFWKIEVMLKAEIEKSKKLREVLVDALAYIDHCGGQWKHEQLIEKLSEIDLLKVN